MARLDRKREHVRVVVALDAAGFGRDVELIVDAAELEGAVEEGAVVEELRGVAREGRDGAVAVAPVEVVRAVPVGKCAARPETGLNLAVIAELERRVFALDAASAVLGPARADTSPQPCRQ